jgi:predicted outer membrane repeat protein
MYFKMTRAAVTIAGGAAALCLGSVPAALAAPASSTYFVPCNAGALYAAIYNAHHGETLDLAPGCTYYVPGPLREIKTELTIVGYHSTLTRTWDAGSFSLLKVGGDLGCVVEGGVLNVNNNPCDGLDGDLTVIDVNFTGGGGYDAEMGGAIDNDGGVLHVIGGTFSDNETYHQGGAIYSDGQLTVNNAAIFTGNRAPYGGAIYNGDEASIGGSSFLWNTSPDEEGTLAHSDGGAIYNDGHLDLFNSGFVGNITGGDGGAIYTKDELNAGHITVTANTADFHGGGIYNDETVTLFASAVFSNQPDNCVDVTGC